MTVNVINYEVDITSTADAEGLLRKLGKTKLGKRHSGVELWFELSSESLSYSEAHCCRLTEVFLCRAHHLSWSVGWCLGDGREPETQQTVASSCVLIRGANTVPQIGVPGLLISSLPTETC